MAAFLHHNLQDALPDDHRGAVIAIGNFDGVHLGHQRVLEKSKSVARQLGCPCYALSFEPHPRTLFRPNSPVFRLTDEAMKARVLEALSINGLLTLPFTKELAATHAEDFVRTFLLDRAKALHVISGFNFHFGKDRGGSPEYLKQAGEKLGFGVTIIDAYSENNADTGDPVSSSRIRRLLGSGDVTAASTLLGYRWMVSGTVEKGAQLGRTLNYPTANLSVAENCHLAHGIYAVRLRRENGKLHNGVASFGRRPTFDNGKVLLETFVFDFSDDLYGENIEISLFEFLRFEEKFDTVDDLVAQMDMDSQKAADILDSATPLSELDEKLTFDGLI